MYFAAGGGVVFVLGYFAVGVELLPRVLQRQSLLYYLNGYVFEGGFDFRGSYYLERILRQLQLAGGLGRGGDLRW